MIVIFVSSFSKIGIASLLHLFRRAKVRINERNTKLNERKQKKNTWVFFCWTRQRQGSVPFLYNKCTNLCTNPLCSSYESQRITLLKVYIPFLGNNIDIYPHLLPLWLSPLVLHPTGSSPSKSGQLKVQRLYTKQAILTLYINIIAIIFVLPITYLHLSITFAIQRVTCTK